MKNNIEENIIDSLDQWLSYTCFADQIPGLAVGIMRKNEVVFNNTYGYADLENEVLLSTSHLFRCASHAKLITAVGILKLVEENKFSLHEKVCKILPWFENDIDKDLENISVYHLLTHTAGIITDGKLTNGRTAHSKKDFIELIQNGIMRYKTDEIVKYSNLGYSILGLIIEEVSGISYSDFIQQNIFEPLSMNNSYLGMPEDISKVTHGYSSFYPDRKRNRVHYDEDNLLDLSAGGLISNVSDLMKFYRAQLDGKESILNNESLKEMMKIQVEINNSKRGLGYEITSFDSGFKICHITGGINGFRSHSQIINDDITIVIMVNTTNTNVHSIAFGILNFLDLKNNFSSEFNFEAPVDFSHYSSYIESPYGIFFINQIGNRLVIFNADSPNPASNPTFLQSIDGNKFTSKNPLPFAKENEEIIFKRDENDQLIFFGSSGEKVPKFLFNSNFRLK
ncbi:MAG: beta-lactamase family protein [Candidatus Heimdallarchaeota archaeon]|nr:beta-lactamase family protein [Candidatus Heimdallarchaeota archaeon]